MLRYALFSLVILALFSCAIETKRGAPEPEETAPVEAPPQAVAPAPKSLKKIITDEDLKKRDDDSELKKRVVVLPILDKKNVRSEAVLTTAANAFMDSLNQSGELIAVDSKVLKLDLKKYIKNTNYDLSAIAKDAAKVGVSALLEPRIVDMRFQNEDTSLVDNSSSLKSRPLVFEIVVQARMISTHTDKELFNTVKTVTIDDSSSTVAENITSDNFFSKNSELSELLIKDALMDFKPKLIEALKQITWEGRIAALNGDKIYLNVGRISGVQVGDILKVVEDGNEIYDTELGYHVGQVQGRVKGTLEIVSFFGQDGSVGVIHSGAGFKENDRIEVYQ
jgi:hypothetical protein